MTRAWILRSLRDDTYEKLAFEREFAAIGWTATGDLASMTSLAEIRQAVRAGYPFVERESTDSYAEQLFEFRVTMTRGDLVFLFRRSTPEVAAGRILGDYQYRSDLPAGIRHIRTVQWMRVDIPRVTIERELVSAPALAMVHRVDDHTEIARLLALVESDDQGTTVMATTPGPAVSESRRPYDDLRRNLNYARSLATAGQHLAHLKVGAFEISDVFRAAWVQGVAALDHWVRQEVRVRLQRLARQSDKNKPRGFTTFKITLGQFERVLQSETSIGEIVDEQFTQAHGHLTYQHPDKIRDAFLLVSDVRDLWNKVAKVLGERAEEGARTEGQDVRERLAGIVRRRNKIAHEYDEDPANPQTKQPVDAATVIQTIDWIEQLAAAILVVLDSDDPAGHRRQLPSRIAE